MKKRLLSAALALAMVLTLLPMSAFAATTSYEAATAGSSTTSSTAADNPVGKSFTYQASTDYKSCAPVTLEQGKWYWKAPADSTGKIKVYVADGGFITTAAAINATQPSSGAWYPNETQYIAKNPSATVFPSSFTLLGSFTNPTTLKWPTTLNVDVYGNALNIPNLNNCGADGQSAMTSITVTDTKYFTSGSRVNVTIPTTNRSTYNAKLTSGVTVKAANVNVGTISLTGRGNTVELNNCASGGITLSGASWSNANSTAVDSWTGQTLRTSNKTNITGAVDILGDSSTVNLQDTTGTGNTVTVEGNGGTVTVGGYSTIGAITVKNNTQTGATTNGAIPTVTVNGGTVNGINTTGANTTASSTFTVNRTTNGINITGMISTNKGTVGVTNATTNSIVVKAGTLNITGPVTDGGTIWLAESGDTTLSVSGAGNSFAGLKKATNKAGTLTISNWPTSRDIYVGDLNLDNYAGMGIKGGTFGSAAVTELKSASNINWVDNTNLQFIVPIVKNNAITTDAALYGKDELTEAISSIAATFGPAASGWTITVLGQDAAPAALVKLNFGSNLWAQIKYNSTTGIKLPTRINNTGVAKWLVKNGAADGTYATGTSIPAGETRNIPFLGAGQDIILDATDTTAEAAKITNATVASSTTVENKDVRVRLNGNTIELSGAVKPGTGGIASIYVNLTTDAVDGAGNILTIPNVMIDYDVNTKKVTFNDINPSLSAYGAIVQDGALVLNRGTGAKYTVTANLAVSASDLQKATLTTNSIVATVGGKLSSWSGEAKKQLIDQIQGGSFTYTGNKAMLEAINAAQATITSNNSVATWIANAKDYIWKNGYTKADGTALIGKHTGNFKDYVGSSDATISAEVGKVTSNFSTAHIVPYLVVNVTDYSANGTLTATLTPYYRVDVSAGSYAKDVFYTVQAGRALSALTGDMSTPIQVKLNLGTNFETKFMHQDGKYVYTGTAVDGWKIYHAGTNGLGTIEINDKDGLVAISASDVAGRNPAHNVMKYDTLQAAVDDTQPGKTQPNTGDSGATTVTETMDTITVDGNYKGSCDFTMTGYARKIKVVALGDQAIKCGSQNVDALNPSGHTYTFQLKRDTAPTGGNITVASATGGTASVSANPATVGSKVTITLSASAGYTASGVSVKTASGQTVSVSGSGSTYTFTMPSGTVTVTPSFTKTQVVNPTVSVGGASTGTGTASTNTSGQVAPGTTVTVTTRPGVGQRTMGINVTGATAIRTGANTFQFSVPSGYTNVVVTPKFDLNNGTLFEDVWSTEYYSNPVRWAVEKGVTNGESTYRFGSGNSCTREQMVTFLYRAAGSPAVGNVNNPFWDVRAGEYYYNAVMWAVSKGITNGVSANQFGVGQPVTRAQAVSFLYRYEGSPAASTNSGFYDVNTREYYAKAVSWANAKGVTNGTSSTMFSPNDYCPREQIVTFLYRDITGNRA